MFNVVVEYLKAFEYLRMVVELVKHTVLNLVVLDDSQHRYLLDTIHYDLGLEVVFFVKFFHEAIAIVLQLVQQFKLSCLLSLQLPELFHRKLLSVLFGKLTADDILDTEGL